MKIQNLVRKYFIDIFLLIILLVIFLGVSAAHVNASADVTNRSVPVTLNKITDLMKSAKMNEAIAPEQAPDFTLMSIDGDKVKLSHKQGKVVLLSFWATW